MKGDCSAHKGVGCCRIPYKLVEGQQHLHQEAAGYTMIVIHLSLPALLLRVGTHIVFGLRHCSCCCGASGATLYNQLAAGRLRGLQSM